MPTLRLVASLIAQLSVERIVVPEPDDGFYLWFHYIGTGKRQSALRHGSTMPPSHVSGSALRREPTIQANVVEVRLDDKSGAESIPPPR